MTIFSDTTNYQGFVQLYERETGQNYGDVSGSVKKLKDFTVDFNNALDTYRAAATPGAGTWELGDSNHPDYAVIYAQINSGQSDYTFITDANGNQIQDIYKVLILGSATETRYRELDPVDENANENIEIIDESNVAGVPSKYGKKENSIRFNTRPNYTVARGIKIIISRTSKYAVYTDTTYAVGYPYHNEYFYLKPSLEYFRRKQIANSLLEKAVIKLEGDKINNVQGLIAKAYSERKKDEVDEVTGEYINSI